MVQKPSFSVVIPTYHRNDLLAKCLECLTPGTQTLSHEQYEVIVTDDGSQTTAAEMICNCYPWAKWVAGPRKGPAANRNHGAKHAQGEWLVFTDDDCLPDVRWLEAYSLAILTESSCLVFEGRTFVDRPRRTLAETAPANESGGYLWSCNFVIQKAIFDSLTGFNEKFPYAAMEDVDLRLRLTTTGYKLAFVKNASVCHPWRYKGGWKKLKQHQKSTLIYLSLHPEETYTINSRYYIRYTLRSFILETLPGIIKYRLAGINEAFIEHVAFIQMAFMLLFFNKNHSLSLSNVSEKLKK